MSKRSPGNSRRHGAVVLLVVLVASLLIFELVLAGCNAILGNEQGSLLDGSTALTCKPGQKACAGSCVDQTDPAVGCSGECTACGSPQNGKAACTLENDSYLCAIGACNAQYADCDDSGANGCETHTTTRAHCGSCGGSCSEPFCEHQGTDYVCSSSCDAPNQPCTSDAGIVDCTDPQTDNSNCGGCGVDCQVPNGSSTCASGKCTAPVCNDKYFLCGGICTLATGAQCGAACAPCGAGTVCDTNPGQKTYGTCVPSSCTQSDRTCGLNCTQDCTLTGEVCNGGACTCANTSDTSCGCPATNCSTMTGSWSCSTSTTPASCQCNGTVCAGSGVCCPSSMQCAGALCLSCPAGSCALGDGGCSTDLTRSPNCGTCGNACTAPDECCPGSVARHRIGLSGGVGPGNPGSYSCTSAIDTGCNP